VFFYLYIRIYMATQRKIDNVSGLTEKLQNAKAVVLTDYRGLTHKQLEEIKKTVKKFDAEYVVAKNSLLLLAINNSPLKTITAKLKEQLQGPTAVFFAHGDEIAPLKELMKIIKSLSLPQIKLGFLGNMELSKDDVVRLVKIPARNILLAQLASQLKAPICGLHRSLFWNMQKLVLVLNAVKIKKS